MTPSSKERAAEDMGTAINNPVLACEPGSLHADGQKFASGLHPESQGCSGLPVTEPAGRGEQGQARMLIFKACERWMSGLPCTYLHDAEANTKPAGAQGSPIRSPGGYKTRSSCTWRRQLVETDLLWQRLVSVAGKGV